MLATERSTTGGPGVALGFQPIAVLATRYRQGRRTHYIITSTIAEVLALVPERVDPHLIKDANRRLHEPHAKAFGDYLWDQEEWISGPLVVGVKPGLLNFEPLGENPNYGLLEFPLSAVNSPEIRLVDGQHRRYGMRYVLDREKANLDRLSQQLRRAKEIGAEPAVVKNLEAQVREKQNRYNRLLNEQEPVIVVEEEDLTDLQQMFADLAKSRPPDPITVSRFDARNPFNMAAVHLCSEHRLLQGRVETERSRLNVDSPYLSTLNQFANNVLKVLEVGINGRVSRRLLAERTAEDITARGQQFLDDLVAARPELAELASGTVTVNDLRAAANLLVSPTTMRVLAGIWWEVVVRSGKPRQVFIDYLHRLAMTPTTDQNLVWIKSGLVRVENGTWTTPTARMQEVRRAVSVAATEAIASAASEN